MSGGAREEYVTDVAYLRNFVEDLAPTRLRLACALNGFAPPPASRFRYCELGSGNGDTLATLAAANPDATFVGLDINAEHVAFAERLAAKGGLANVRFLEADFADFASCAPGDPLGRFHYVGAHGVLSWVSPEKRRALIDFAAARLEPGGLLTVSYNALPGWAAIEPLRRLMLDATTAVTGTTADRARHGIKVARLVADGGADYFQQHPTARSMLDAMDKGGLAYVSHEYFHTHWNPMYFTDVAGPMAEAGLFYVGQLPLYLNYKDLAIPASLGPLLAGVTDRIVLERMKDYAVNEFFRRDVYIKGRAPCSRANTDAYFETTPLGAAAGRVQREIKLPHATLALEGEVFDAVIPEICGRGATAVDLASRPHLAAFGLPRIRDALLRLALADQLAPLTTGEPPKPPPQGRPSVPLAYNRMVLEQRISRANPVVLASLASGTGLALSTMHAACLHLVTEVEPGDRPAWIARFVQERAARILDGDRAIVDREEQARVMSSELEQFITNRVPELRALGILA